MYKITRKVLKADIILTRFSNDCLPVFWSHQKYKQVMKRVNFVYFILQAKLAFERLMIEHVYHPFISGGNASKISEQTGARINIPPPSAQKNEITIAGEKEGVAKAKEMVLAIYEEKKRKTTTVSIEVKKSQHKYVIGPRGGTLQEILTLTGKEKSK